MDYEKLYKEALERAKDFMNGEAHYELKMGENIMCWIFPELRESEDEKIRKWLLNFVQGLPDDGLDFHFYNLNKEQVVAWLEKQGTSYTKRDIDDAYVEGMAFAKDELEKQKPTWSEEDDSILSDIVNHFDGFPLKHQTHEIFGWLVSLKHRIG